MLDTLRWCPHTDIFRSSLSKKSDGPWVHSFHQVAVKIHCHIDPAVAELALNVSGMFSVSKQE